jgi:uncharacterized membrane protein
MMFLWPLFLIAIVAGAVLLVRALSNRGSEMGDPAQRAKIEQRRHALSILEERFASGEIDGEEFEERRRILQS